MFTTTLRVEETKRIIAATRVLSYRVFFFTLYSLGLRLGEGLRLQVGDIDAARGRVHVCPHCGLKMPRDQNSASVVLIDAHTPGTGVAARPKPLPRQRGKSKSVTRETPTTTAIAV